jgi:hypothetical protein
MIQSGLGVFCGVIPVVLSFITQAMQLELANVVFIISLMFADIYPLFVNIVTILMLKGYRDAALHFLNHLGCMCFGRHLNIIKVRLSRVSQSNT